MVICDFRPLSCLSIVVSISIGWGCDQDAFLLATWITASYPHCLSSCLGCESTYLGFTMSRKIGRTLAANISSSDLCFAIDYIFRVPSCGMVLPVVSGLVNSFWDRGGMH